jgi:MoaA/NifB/PqqE/SkfB family radical SAM enzyme
VRIGVDLEDGSVPARIDTRLGPIGEREANMELTGLHLLLTYKCTLECDHCFVWGSPWQEGTMTLRQLDEILQQATDLGSIQWIYFEGGEPFLYHAVLQRGVARAAAREFQVGIVSNAYWATNVQDALEWLRPFQGTVQDLSLSSDQYHRGAAESEIVDNAREAAEKLGIPVDVITIAQPGVTQAAKSYGQLPKGESSLMFRGRAARKLVDGVALRAWDLLDECPYEDLRNPGRVHVDPMGNVHVCQGISLGNLFQKPLKAICEQYDPEQNPVVGPLLGGGPAELARRYVVPHADAYADACHLCDGVRRTLRWRFPEILAPDPMYGVLSDDDA